MKVASIVGARPQFIKTALLSPELRIKHNEVLIHTGQHYDWEMSKVFFDELDIPKPDYNLGVGSGPQGKQTGEMLAKIEGVLSSGKPDLVIVHGDTNSTLAGALSAVKLHIPVAHIEAGMRSFDRSMPEELNRIVSDHVSNILFCPTETAVSNLKKEGLTKNVHLVGDVMADLLVKNLKIANEKSKILRALGLGEKDYILVTVHRAGNTNVRSNLKGIVDALLSVDDKIVFPMHPRTKKYLIEYGLYDKLESAERIVLSEPVGYLDFLKLQKNAKKIATDSGGVQKEAYLLKVPCITLRENTEWVETVEDGWNTLVGANKERMVAAVSSFSPSCEQTHSFGAGNSAKNIVDLLDSLS